MLRFHSGRIEGDCRSYEHFAATRLPYSSSFLTAKTIRAEWIRRFRSAHLLFLPTAVCLLPT